MIMQRSLPSYKSFKRGQFFFQISNIHQYIYLHFIFKTVCSINFIEQFILVQYDLPEPHFLRI